MSDVVSPYQDAANTAADLYKVPREIFSSLVNVESSWNPWTTGKKGEIGLTQLLPRTANSLNINAYDPVANLNGGASFLASLYDKYKDWKKALSAYNSGSPDSTAGAQYADKVLAQAQTSTPSPTNPATAPTTNAPKSTFEEVIDNFAKIFGGGVAQTVNGPAPTPGEAQATDQLGEGTGAAIEHGLATTALYVVAGVVVIGAFLIGLYALSTAGYNAAVTTTKKAVL